MLADDCRVWLPDNLLDRGDRMTMAASVELRPPFLDHRLVELGFSLPSRMKVRGSTTKWIIKEVARKLLPGDIVDRPKMGFRVPIDAWLRGGLRDMAWDRLLSSTSFTAEAFDRTVVEELLSKHDRGERNHQFQIWTLLSLEVWHETMFSSTAGVVGSGAQA